MNGILRLLILILIFGTLQAPTLVFAEKRNQLEELFIWKMSEELKLSALEEKKFTEIVKNINSDKSKLNKELQDAVVKMAKLSTEKEKADSLKQYRKTLEKYNSLSEIEIEKMQSLLGVSRTLQYLQFKQDLTNRVKSLLASPEANSKAPSKPLPAPQVIEEK